jgi:hypothetical protein
MSLGTNQCPEECSFSGGDRMCDALLSVEGRRLEARMTLPDIDNVVPVLELTYTPGGRPTSRAISKTNRNELYGRLVGSQLLALLRLFVAAVPGATTIELHAELTTGERIACGTFAREVLAAVPNDPGDVLWALRAAGLDVRQKGRTNTSPLSIKRVLRKVAESAATPFNHNVARVATGRRMASPGAFQHAAA